MFAVMCCRTHHSFFLDISGEFRKVQGMIVEVFVKGIESLKLQNKLAETQR